MKAIWRREINVRSLGLTYERPEQFIRCQWQKNTTVSITYFVYRWAFAFFFLSVWIWSFISAKEQNTPTENFLSKWPIYLTNWGYTLCTTQALLAVGLITHQLIKERTTGFTEEYSQMPVIYKVYWMLHTLAVVIAIGITGSYFVIEYNPDIHTLSALNLLIHAFNSIFMVLDVIMVAHPFRLIHICWSLLFIFVYFCFSAIYYLAGGTGKNNTPYIYPALDWSKVESTILIVILGMLTVIVSHFCVWLIVLIRKRIAGCEDDVCQQSKISTASSKQVQSMNAAVP